MNMLELDLILRICSIVASIGLLVCGFLKYYSSVKKYKSAVAEEKEQKDCTKNCIPKSDFYSLQMQVGMIYIIAALILANVYALHAAHF